MFYLEFSAEFLLYSYKCEDLPVKVRVFKTNNKWDILIIRPLYVSALTN